MADWSNPVLASAYSDVLDILKERDEDAGTLFLNTPSNQPTGAIKFDRTNNKFQEWDGATWQDKVLAVAGGGTGAATATGARTNLGLGTIATQNSNSVAITGGSITALGTFSLAADITFTTDGTRNIGSNATRPNIIYSRNGLVAPVGADKWVTT